MSQVNFVRFVLAAAVLATAVACSSNPPTTAPFAFSRPEHVEFVCINPAGSARSAMSPLVLPLNCCAPATPLDPDLFFEADERLRVCRSGGASLHALVTQSTRGEVAAVDLVERRVLDSDQRIPGYTFVDVGGLPRAIVTPPHKPGAPDVGPPWTYVASAEEQSLRAIATCHFREGAACGPEFGRDAATQKIPLPGQPKDMLLANDDALWLTLPEVSAIARVGLPLAGDDPFAPSALSFFRVPVVDDPVPAAPVHEASEYVAACGLGYTLAKPLSLVEVTLPVSDSAPGLGVASPTRLRFDEQTGLLFVADRSQPVIHALSIENDELQVRGAIATGAPIRDFALTPAVPRLLPQPLAFVKRGEVDEVPTFGPDEQRYLYAIDDRDGSVMVHAFEYAGGVVTTQPLRVPAARERSDRLPLGAPAIAIEIVDNRPRSKGLVCDWGRDTALTKRIATDLQKLRSAEKVLSDANAAFGAADPDQKAAAREGRDAAKTAYDKLAVSLNKLRSERAILDSADALSLRGVFALITSLDGRLGVVDVHDLDVFCRGERGCKSATQRTDDAAAAPVAVRRHTLRLTGVAQPQLVAREPAAFDAVTTCDDGRYAAAVRGVATVVPGGSGGREPGAGGGLGGGDGGMSDAGLPDAAPGSDVAAGAPPNADRTILSEDDVLVCSIRDPWLNTNPGFVAVWEGQVFSAAWSGERVTEPDPNDASGEQTVLRGPSGLDLCERGVIGADSDVEPDYAGDWAVIVGPPSSFARGPCVTPEQGSEPHFRILQAYSDRLVLGAPERSTGFTWDCYPDVVTFEVRAAERFFVYPRTSVLYHRVIAAADGHCVADPARDSSMVARAEPGTSFSNAFATVALSKAAPKTSDVVVTVESVGANNGFWQPVYVGPAASTSSQPVSIRYLNVTGDVYVVDVSQGLRRFTLTPFRPDITPYR